MSEEIKFMFGKLEKKDFYTADVIEGYRIWKVIHTDEGGYTENDLRIYVHKDGSVSISGDGDGEFVYIYPEHVKYLKDILNNIENK